ncbi:Type-1 fimbrial protein, A chain [Alloalcanivorax dieselolei B5]|uniref:Type-1 fimbrial protein, A chain n=1 Tax=Alcanivorax dieselolei (strain DSM 16502 / CGMCC 1.3690 / MCCC 1A00001 / B-5) TaxID=930169 RepID=K0C7A6_ALCDB|nr:fimbrial protein [Alloalcanivorax dieselolei]AFT68418.1 Type-1 fimbrial protein, A chain [Alloalcanivorax dieselolei B5]GGJ99815.1 fimbrial protein [Alloalcanivorax dieselolei]
MRTSNLIVVLAATLSTSAFANTGEVFFNGVVTDTTCTVDVAQNGVLQADNTVTLDPIATADFVAADTPYSPAAFSLVATDAGSATCDLTGLGATVLWTGQAYAGHNILENIAADPATSVGVILLEQDGTTPVQINGASVSIVDASSGELQFNAAYGATDTATVTAGHVRAVANYSVVFN